MIRIYRIKHTFAHMLSIIIAFKVLVGAPSSGSLMTAIVDIQECSHIIYVSANISVCKSLRMSILVSNCTHFLGRTKESKFGILHYTYRNKNIGYVTLHYHSFQGVGGSPVVRIADDSDR